MCWDCIEVVGSQAIGTDPVLVAASMRPNQSRLDSRTVADNSYVDTAGTVTFNSVGTAISGNDHSAGVSRGANFNPNNTDIT